MDEPTNESPDSPDMDNEEEDDDDIVREFMEEHNVEDLGECLTEACWRSRWDVAEQLLLDRSRNPPVPVNVPDEFGATPFHHATRYGNIDICKLLWQTGEIDVDARRMTQSGYTALHGATYEGHLHMVQWLLLEANSAIDKLTHTGQTVLHIACKYERTEVCRWLILQLRDNPEQFRLENTANLSEFINLPDQKERTALLYAISSGIKSEIQSTIVLLMVHGADWSSFANNINPLYVACRFGYLDVLETCVTFHLTTSSDWWDDKALRAACISGHSLVAEYLLDVCPNSRVIDKAWQDANQHGHWEVLKVLIRSKKAKRESIGGIFFTACKEEGKDHIVRYFIEEGDPPLDLLFYDENSGAVSPLMVACRYNRLSTVKILVSEGSADVSMGNDLGMNPLLVASREGHISVVQYLVQEAQAHASAPDRHLETPLFKAAQSGQLPVVQFLVEHTDAEIDQVDDDNQTPMSIACRNNHFAIVKFLVEAGAQIDSVDDTGRTPFYYATGNRSLEIPQFLHQTGRVDPNAPDIDGNTPLLHACEYYNANIDQHVQIIDWLLWDVGVNTSTVNNQKRTAHGHAIWKNLGQYTECFVRREAHIQRCWDLLTYLNEGMDWFAEGVHRGQAGRDDR